MFEHSPISPIFKMSGSCTDHDKSVRSYIVLIQNCENLSIYFMNFFKILTFKSSKIGFKKNSLKNN